MTIHTNANMDASTQPMEQHAPIRWSNWTMEKQLHPICVTNQPTIFAQKCDGGAIQTNQRARKRTKQSVTIVAKPFEHVEQLHGNITHISNPKTIANPSNKYDEWTISMCIWHGTNDYDMCRWWATTNEALPVDAIDVKKSTHTTQSTAKPALTTNKVYLHNKPRVTSPR